jgi:hypothetical protein
MRRINSHSLFYATIGFNLFFNKKKLLSRKKPNRSRFAFTHNTITSILSIKSFPGQAADGREDKGSTSAGLFYDCGKQVLLGFIDEFADRLKKVDLPAVQIRLIV